MQDTSYSPVTAEQRARIIAMSRYRQVRLTFTQEASGRVSWSVYAKPLNAPWNEHSCILRDSAPLAPYPLLTTEDVFGLIVTLIQSQMLPGVD